MPLEVQSNFLQTTENNAQRFDRAVMGKKPKELPSFVGRTFTKDELCQYVDDKVRANKARVGSFEAVLAESVQGKADITDKTINRQAENQELYERSRVEALVKQYGEDNPYSKALRGLEKSFDATFPNASDDIKAAWIDMSIDRGMNEITGISLDGKHSHISQILAQKATRDYNIQHGNFQYVEEGWGESVKSMMNILKKAIYDIENPLQGEPTHSAEAQRLRENEKNFYVKFMEEMGWNF